MDNKRGRIVVVAGTNGAGKSSIVGEFMAEKNLAYFNPDLLARELVKADKPADDANGLAWRFGYESLRRAVDRAVALPFASPNAFILGHAQKKEGREVVTISQIHHRAIVDAIANREPTRAEALAREHSRLARTSLEMVLRDKRLLTQVPGASLIRFPEAV